MTGIREFRKKICCGHAWAPPIPEFDGCDVDDAEDGERVEVCGRCGSKCERDSKGRIVDFDALWNWGKQIPMDDFSGRPTHDKKVKKQTKQQREVRA